MIQLPSQKEIMVLKDFHEPLCLSMYLPSVDPEAGSDNNRIQLKNLLREAETALRAAGAAPGQIKKTLRPARTLVEDGEFWPVRGQSLALFMHPKLFRSCYVPDPVAPYQLSVGTGFNLEPLEGFMSDNKPYFVLALSHKHVQLYEGDKYQMKPLKLKDFPADMKTALNIDEYPNWRETHEIAPASQGKGSAGFHGQYNVHETDKVMLLQFFRLIDKRLHSFLRTKHTPLVIGGVGYLLPIYREANTFPYLQSKDIKGSLEHTTLDSIRERAWSLVGAAKSVH